jgi:Rrf2 family protein
MVPVSTKVSYGLLFLALLAKKDKPVSVTKAAQELHLPVKYLGRIAYDLARAGILVSKEGRAGGYRLARVPKRISVGEIFRSLGFKTSLPCLLGRPCERERYCLTKTFWKRLSDRMQAILNDFTLADLV